MEQKESQYKEILEIPECFKCPITGELMEDPVVVLSGHCYESKAITDWFERGNDKDPSSGIRLPIKKSFPVFKLKEAIDLFKKQMPEFQRLNIHNTNIRKAVEQREQMINELVVKIDSKNTELEDFTIDYTNKIALLEKQIMQISYQNEMLKNEINRISIEYNKLRYENDMLKNELTRVNSESNNFKLENEKFLKDREAINTVFNKLRDDSELNKKKIEVSEIEKMKLKNEIEELKFRLKRFEASSFDLTNTIFSNQQVPSFGSPTPFSNNSSTVNNVTNFSNLSGISKTVMSNEIPKLVENLNVNTRKINSNNNSINHAMSKNSSINATEVSEFKVAIDPKINDKDNSGCTKLQRKIQAYSKGELNQIKELISQGADVNTKDNKGKTPFFYSAVNESYEVMDLLISKGANIDEEDDEGTTALHFASFKGNLKLVKYLVSNKADITKKNYSGWNALHLSVRYNHLDLIMYLCIIGCNINEKNKSGYNSLHIASKLGNRDIIKFLLSSGANVNDKINSGDTALHIAAMHGHKEIVSILLDSKALINEKNSNSKTAKEVAQKNGHNEIVKMLS